VISVIIPTMWRAAHTKRLLKLLETNDLVGEIVLIDNDSSKTIDLSKFSKVKHYPQKENQYVNGSWNLGVRLSRFDKLCICNDDCLVNLNFLKDFVDEITPEKGLIGFSEKSFLHDRTDDLSLYDQYTDKGFGDKIFLEKRTEAMPHICYGVCMFVHKSNYREIPEDFKVDFGDLFNYVINIYKYNIPNYEIHRGFILTKMSSTGIDFSEHKERERKIFYDVFKKYGIQ